MDRPRFAAPALLALLAAAACGGASTAAAPAPAPAGAASGSCGAASTQQRVAAALRFARGRFRLEADGEAVHAALALVGADRALAAAMGRGDFGAAKAEALRLVRGHHHITAIRVLRGQRVVVETMRYPFDVAGSQAPLRDRRGAVVGTLQVTIQDVIGFIRLVHKFTGSQVLVRGAAGEAKSSLPAALGARLPAAGCATLAGRTYAVRSFPETSFTGEALTIWVLRASSYSVASASLPRGPRSSPTGTRTYRTNH
jgi:hypothetical protein